MSSSKKEITPELIKGKIAEVIFEQLFRTTNKYTILHFGYEYTHPELAQYKDRVNDNEEKKALKFISKSPDYILVSEDKKDIKIRLVEVKFQTEFDIDFLKKDAEELESIWPGSWLFVASLDQGFSLSRACDIKDGRNTEALPSELVPENIQNYFLQILKEFEPKYK